ncbi:MAG: UbiA family prenyltransferase [Bacteroidia bacterium]|nr:UbiA family prenyltransferase [Bacteroidia bacterium]MDW8057296.1 UbiA family prenyltransferase [Bacteroidia bacterium]
MGAVPSYRRLPARTSVLRRTLRRIEALVRLSRPVNLMLIAGTSLSAQLLLWLRGKDFIPDWERWFYMLLSTILIAAGGYWINDLYDQPIDRINRPSRAMWVARAGQRLLITAVLGAWLLATLLAILLPLKILFLHMAAIFTLAWYARFGKRTGLLGNAVIAILTGAVPWEVLLLAERTAYGVVWMVPLAIGFNFVRELVKDAEDLPGDQAYGVRSLPSHIPKSSWHRLLYFLWVGLIFLTFAPAVLHYVLWKSLPLPYLSAALVVTILPLLWGLQEWGNYRLMSQSIKMAMAGGLVAVWML